jgi:hypothetical protein
MGGHLCAFAPCCQAPTFAIPGFFVILFTANTTNSDAALDEAGWRTQHFSAAQLYPNTTGVVAQWPLVQFNSWAYGTGINESSMTQALEVVSLAPSVCVSRA